MQVKVIFPPDERSPLKEFIWDVDTADDSEALEKTFREFNVVEEGDSHIDRNCRSMSVGDIAICIDSLGQRIYICDNAGWKQVNSKFAQEWMKLPFSKRILGPSAAI
jgi:hypothetical protein